MKNNDIKNLLIIQQQQLLEQQKQLVLKQAETDRASKEILFAIEEDFNQKIENARQARREKEAQARQRDILKSIRYANELIKIEQNRLKAEQNIQTQRVCSSKPNGTRRN